MRSHRVRGVRDRPSPPRRRSAAGRRAAASSRRARPAPGRLVRVDEHELAAALREPEEEREQRGADEQPAARCERRRPRHPPPRGSRTGRRSRARRRGRSASARGCTRAAARRTRAGRAATRSRARPRSRTRRPRAAAASTSARSRLELAACDRPVALDRVEPVVVRIRRSLTRYAALDAAQYATKIATASPQRPASPSFAAKTIPAKSSRFFDHCRGRSDDDRGRDSGCAAGEARRPRPAPGRVTSRRQHQLERRPVADLRLELDAAAERLRELVRDREPETGAATVARPERTEDPLRSSAVIPGPVSATDTAIAAVLLRRGRARCGRRRASSGTRSRAGS